MVLLNHILLSRQPLRLKGLLSVFFLVRLAGFEPATYGVETHCSNPDELQAYSLIFKLMFNLSRIYLFAFFNSRLQINFSFEVL